MALSLSRSFFLSQGPLWESHTCIYNITWNLGEFTNLVMSILKAQDQGPGIEMTEEKPLLENADRVLHSVNEQGQSQRSAYDTLRARGLQGLSGSCIFGNFLRTPRLLFIILCMVLQSQDFCLTHHPRKALVLRVLTQSTSSLVFASWIGDPIAKTNFTHSSSVMFWKACLLLNACPRNHPPI